MTDLTQKQAILIDLKNGFSITPIDALKEHGKDLVPAKYPEPYNTQWNETYAKKDWNANYPFDRENIEDFAKFCLESGGFSIC